MGTIHYSYSLPTDFNPKDNKTYPLIVAVPGIGEMLSNGRGQAYNPPSGHIKNWQGFINWSNAIVVCPQMELSIWSNPKASTQIMELIGRMKVKFPNKINVRKIYGIGFSAGACVMSNTVNNNPGTFAAYAHGGYDWVGVPNTTSQNAKQILDNIARNKVSVCFYGSEGDVNCRWSIMEQIKSYLQNKGCNVKVEKSSGYDHGAGQNCLKTSSFRNWLLSQ